uniref:Neuritin 1 n=1 Tax=Felis catus TaxID=9685 RepID=A0ABI7XQT4_FELCA
NNPPRWLLPGSRDFINLFIQQCLLRTHQAPRAGPRLSRTSWPGVQRRGPTRCRLAHLFLSPALCCRDPLCHLRNARLHFESQDGLAGEVLGNEGGSEEKGRNKRDGGAYLVQAVRAAGKCDAVFKGFSDCLLKLGDSMANYPQGLDDKTNIKTVCTYWEDFHSCTVTALTDCQEGAKDMWDKLRKESKNLNIQGSLFELCGSGNGAAGSLLPALPVLLVSLSAALATWLSF